MDPTKRGRGGARPGAGRKPNATRLELNSLMDECVGLEKRRQILKSAVEQAESGSIQHQQFIFGYLYGKPAQRLELSGDPNAPVRVVYVNDWRSGEPLEEDSGDQS
jgi:hypothetical protein